MKFKLSSFISLFLIGIVSIQAQSRKHLGDLLFDQNKTVEEYSFKSMYNNVEIGRLIKHNQKHAVIFQQIDSIQYLNQLKFISFENGKIKESIIDTLDVGILIEFEFLDRTFDGHNDLLISIGGNRLLDHLYVFDPNNNTLIKIPDFQNYPSTQKVKDKKLLFSYLALGCGGNIWESKLIKIEGFKVVELGRVYGQNCDDNDKPIIEISATNIKIKYLPYFSTLEKYSNGKFDFIKDHWNMNSSN